MPRRYEGMAYWEMVSRHMGLLSKVDQVKLRDSTVTVIGCGGIGGAGIEMLARMGIGGLRIVDSDVFGVSNMNRQIMSSFHDLKLPKSEVTAERIRKINPFVEVEVFNEIFTWDNADGIIGESDIVVDALDNITGRVIASRKSRERGIPFIHGAVHGSRGQVTVFTVNSPSYEEMFRLPSAGCELTDGVLRKLDGLSSDTPPVLGPLPNLTGCIQSFEALKILTGRGNVMEAPRMLNFDLMGEEPFRVIEVPVAKTI